MKIYHYHPETKQFIGVGIADPDPLEKGKFLIPACATDREPPQEIQGKILVFDNGQWQHIDRIFTPEEETPALSDEEKMQIVRQERNKRLAECDWTQLSDAPLSNDPTAVNGKGAWAAYRHELRSFPENVDLDNIVWPTKPE